MILFLLYFHCLIGVIIATAAVMAVKREVPEFKEVSKSVNFLANILIWLVVFLTWPFWVGAYLNRYI